MPDLPPELLRTPIAHRGLHDPDAGVIENSVSSFRAAIAAGYGIECDLQCSADGQAMVFHDYDLGRLTGVKGPIAQQSCKALQQMQLTGSDDTIPTLAELLNLVDGQVPLLIELKDQDGALGADVGGLERAVATALADYEGAAALMSFNPHSIAALADMAIGLPVGLTTCDFAEADWGLIPPARRDALRGIPDFDRLGACFVSHDHRTLDTAPVARLRAQKVPILTWTIRNTSQEIAARRIADNITFEGYLPAH